MNYFEYRAGRLHAESVDLLSLASEVGTPAYVYSRAAIEAAWRGFDDGLERSRHLVCYAVKANSNLAVLNVLAQLGSGFDIVSGGELERVLVAGGEPQKIVFSGVGKTEAEMERALEVGIRCFNAESVSEVKRLSAVAARMNRTANLSLRVNPDVDPETHPYIATGLSKNKFGIAIAEAREVFQLAHGLPGLNVVGVDCHIGSQLTNLGPIGDAISRILDLVDALASDGIQITEVDVGGGVGIRYQDEQPPSMSDYGALVSRLIGNRNVEVVVEPGRSIVGNAGVLLSQVEYIKRNGEHQFAIVDAAMNDYIRPALYQAWSDIIPLLEDEVSTDNGTDGEFAFDIVGPVCESGDFLGWGRPMKVKEGSLLAVMSSGAYGFVMSSNYNTRGRAAEVMVDGDSFTVVRPREDVTELFATERVLPTG